MENTLCLRLVNTHILLNEKCTLYELIFLQVIKDRNREFHDIPHYEHDTLDSAAIFYRPNEISCSQDQKHNASWGWSCILTWKTPCMRSCIPSMVQLRISDAIFFICSLSSESDRPSCWLARYRLWRDSTAVFNWKRKRNHVWSNTQGIHVLCGLTMNLWS